MTDASSIPWVEKYRPSTLDALVTRPEVVETRISSPSSALSQSWDLVRRLTQQSFFPHLLLFGPPGTGKTSAILAVARTLYGTNYHDRGIQVVRECIKDCAQSASLIQSEVRFKLIILDECDNMTKDAQMSLRRVMEGATKNVRFCLMCNQPNALLPAIRSRCAQLRFPPLDPSLAKARLKEIIQQEKMEVSEEGLGALVKIAGGDLRQSLNTLQFLKVTEGSVGAEQVYEAVGYPSSEHIEAIMHHLFNSNHQTAFNAISTLCSQQGYALVDVMQEVATRLIHQQALPSRLMVQLVVQMGDYEKRLSGAAHEHLQLLGWIGSFIEARESLLSVAQ